MCLNLATFADDASRFGLRELNPFPAPLLLSSVTVGDRMSGQRKRENPWVGPPAGRAMLTQPAGHSGSGCARPPPRLQPPDQVGCHVIAGVCAAASVRQAPRRQPVRSLMPTAGPVPLPVTLTAQSDVLAHACTHERTVWPANAQMNRLRGRSMLGIRAGNEIRTRDLLHGKQMLYQLSYSRFKVDPSQPHGPKSVPRRQPRGGAAALASPTIPHSGPRPRRLHERCCEPTQ